MTIWKAPPFEVPAEEPLTNDKLRRGKHILNLGRLIKTAREPLVVSVDGDWGAGKTTFLRMLEADMRRAGSKTLWFDAWKHDFVDDPVVALISALDDGLDQGSKARVMSQARAMGGAILQAAVPIAFRAMTAGAIDHHALEGLKKAVVGGVGEQMALAAEEKIDSFREALRTIEGFRSSLSSLARTESSTGPGLIFFVDELDRCRPDFAIKVLERIKHLFSVEGTVFVLGVNQDQLAHSIKAVYGNIDAPAYLDRFVDLRFWLPIPDYSVLLPHVAEASGLASLLKGRIDEVLEALGWIARTAPVPTRLVQKIVGDLALVLRLQPQLSSADSPVLALTVLVALRSVNRREYYALVSGGSGKDAVAALGGIPAVVDGRERPRSACAAVAALYALHGQTDEYVDRRDALARGGEPWEAGPHESELELLRAYGEGSNSLRRLLPLIELLGPFEVEGRLSGSLPPLSGEFVGHYEPPPGTREVDEPSSDPSRDSASTRERQVFDSSP